MSRIQMDFETACAAELKYVGAYKYSRHETFRITTLRYRLTEGGEIFRWIGFYDAELNPDGTELVPDNLVEAIQRGDFIHAWNASFERYCLQWMADRDPRILNIPYSQYRCTMQRAAIVGLPLGLAVAGDAVRADVLKDGVGKQVMMQTAKPRNGAPLPKSQSVRTPKDGDPTLTWYSRADSPEKFVILDDYCGVDVESEGQIEARLPEMRRGELALAAVDAEVNHRGLPIDRASVEQALLLIDFVKADGDQRLSDLTGGAVEKASQLPKLKAWLAERGCEMESVTKASIPTKLEDPDLSDEVRAVLNLRLEGSAASLSKLQTMLHLCCDDGTMKDQFQYSGAHTGRWAGRGSQPQNFVKGWDDPAKQDIFFRLLNQDKTMVEIAADLRAEFGDLVEAMKGALRGFICAPEGYEFYVCDFSGIENVELAWLADEPELLETFRAGGDAYRATAARMYDITEEEVSPEQRSKAKVCVLAAQFGQGPKGYQCACAQWGMHLPIKECRETIQAYREANPNIKQFWYDLYRAMMSSVSTGSSYTVGRVVTEYSDDSLRVVLPSGRKIYYWRPVVREELAPWSYSKVRCVGWTMTEGELEQCGCLPIEGKVKGLIKVRDCDADAFYDVVKKRKTESIEYVEKFAFQLYHEQKAKNNTWPQINKQNPNRQHSTWHGVAVENVTQAVARDVLAEAVLRVERNFFHHEPDGPRPDPREGVIGYVHDEIIALVKTGGGPAKSYAEFSRVMLQVPRWNSGAPIKGAGYVATRYRK